MSEDNNLIDFFTALEHKEHQHKKENINQDLAYFINIFSSEINNLLQNEAINKEFLAYLIFNRLLKILDYLPIEKKEEVLYLFLTQLSEAENSLLGEKNATPSSKETDP